MEKQLSAATGVPDTTISLQELVSNLVISFLPAANHNNTHVMNEIGQGIALSATMDKAIAVIKDILVTVIGNSRNGEIHITADKYKDVVLLQIQERNNYNGYALAFSIGSIEHEAASIGGHLTIKGQQQKITTISFSFPNLLAA